jgi:hypothetical protein
MSSAGVWLTGCALWLTGCASGIRTTPVEVPPALRVPAGETLTLQLHGTGVQIYRCDASQSDPQRYEWVLVAPKAELRSSTGVLVGRHYAGPTWAGLDGSAVVGEVVARDPGPDAGAVPWLLLKAKSTSGGGTFGSVTHIQRIATRGGKGPAGQCAAAQEHATVGIPYQADYRFFSPGR